MSIIHRPYRRTRGATFEFRSPCGTEMWTFNGIGHPAEFDCGITSPYMEIEQVLDEDGDERDAEAYCPMWWREVCEYGDQLVRDEWYGDGL